MEDAHALDDMLLPTSPTPSKTKETRILTLNLENTLPTFTRNIRSMEGPSMVGDGCYKVNKGIHTWEIKSSMQKNIQQGCKVARLHGQPLPKNGYVLFTRA